MAIVTVLPYAMRTTVTLTTAEWWQVEGEPIRFNTGTPTSNKDGIRLGLDMATVRFESGETVTVWLAGNVGSSIVRMPVK